MPALRTSKPSGALRDTAAVCAMSVAAPSADAQIAATDNEIRLLRVAISPLHNSYRGAGFRCALSSSQRTWHLYFKDFDAVCQVASPQMTHVSPTKYPLPLALV